MHKVTRGDTDITLWVVLCFCYFLYNILKLCLEGGLVLDKKLLGRYIRVYRIKKGLTQAELAEIVNVATGMIGQYERGKKSPSRETLFELARTLEFSVDALIFKSETTNKKVFSDDFFEKLDKLTVMEQKVALNAAEAVIDTFLNN